MDSPGQKAIKWVLCCYIENETIFFVHMKSIIEQRVSQEFTLDENTVKTFVEC